MAAEILETQPEDETLDQLPEDSEAQTPEQLVQEFADGGQTPEPPFEAEQLPDKYKGKSIQEVVSMHQEAERLIGSQGSEVGELRKVVDQYINVQLESQAQAAEEEKPDFFEDPEAAVSHAIEHHPEVVQARQAAQAMQRTTSVQQLAAKHPDMQQVLGNPAFLEWATGSTIRKELFERADKGYDVGAADELISNFKERSAVAQQTAQAEQGARQQAVKQATTGSASASNNAGAKRVYRRADIIKLMKTDPDRYEALSPEIMQAYAEGRVK